ncbi:hypothetical protein JIN77_02190 [Verrucomicrobiaceae bacterium R5-34]|nr:hypothetical protein [Verrucomicrobiaceae bacterium R5-34]
MESIMRRPGMYWGDSDNHFHSFIAFLSGYQIARDEILDEEARNEMDQIIPPKFHEFVTEYYGHTFPHGGHGWTSFIEDHSETDREALDLFLKLRRLYDEQNNLGEQDAGDQAPAAVD